MTRILLSNPTSDRDVSTDTFISLSIPNSLNSAANASSSSAIRLLLLRAGWCMEVARSLLSLKFSCDAYKLLSGKMAIHFSKFSNASTIKKTLFLKLLQVSSSKFALLTFHHNFFFFLGDLGLETGFCLLGSPLTPCFRSALSCIRKK